MTFTCPQCGSNHFGSSQNEDGTLERNCYGYRQGGACMFTFHQSEDHRYFTPDENDQPEGVVLVGQHHARIEAP